MTARPWLIALEMIALGMFAWVAFAASARAQAPQAPSDKVLLIGAADDAAVLRMRDELRLLGLRVQVLDTTDPVEVETLASRLGADAVAEVQRWPPEIRLWVQGTEGDPSTLAVGDSLTAGEPELLALRAVELLRARLLPVPPGGKPPPAPTTSPVPPAPAPLASSPSQASPHSSSPEGPASHDGVPSPPAPVPSGVSFDDGEGAPPHAEELPDWGLFAGPSLATQPGGPSPALQLGLGFEYRLIPRLSLALRGLIPTHAASVNASGGDASLRALAVGAAVRVTLTDPFEPFGVVAAAGLGATGLFYRGQPRGAGRALDGASWGASPFAALAGRYALTEGWALRLEVEAGLVLPRQVIRIAGEEAGSVGFPAVGITAGVEVWP